METQNWKAVAKFDDEDDDNFFLGDAEAYPPPPGKRLAPVGANAEDDENSLAKDSSDKEHSVVSSPGFSTGGDQMSSRFWGSGSAIGDNYGGNKELEDKIKSLERDQEELNNSLMSMTSHFAKVQLRLQQVVSAPAENKEALLVELQTFAFRGIPDVSTPAPQIGSKGRTFSFPGDDDYDDGIDDGRRQDNHENYNGKQKTSSQSTPIRNSTTGN